MRVQGSAVVDVEGVVDYALRGENERESRDCC